MRGQIVGRSQEQTPAPRISDRDILQSGAAVNFSWSEIRLIWDTCNASEDISKTTKEKVMALYRYARLKTAYFPTGKTTITAK